MIDGPDKVSIEPRATSSMPSASIQVLSMQLDPNYAAAHMRLGSAYARKQQYNQAVIEMLEGISLDKIPARLATLGEVYVHWGKRKKVRHDPTIAANVETKVWLRLQLRCFTHNSAIKVTRYLGWRKPSPRTSLGCLTPASRPCVRTRNSR